jgi:hypothetical protein
MQVITKNPIIVDGVYEDYLALDGTSSKEEILAAQKIINQLIKVENTFKQPSQWLRAIKEDGVWGNETNIAYTNRKERVDAELEKIKQMLGAFAKGGASGGFSTALSETSKIQTQDKLSWWKKRTKNQKTAIIIVGSLTLLTIGYFAYKKSNK